MKVLLTGVSSFTGCHIGRALVGRGWEVRATLTRESASYSDDSLVQKRFSHSLVEDFVYEAPFGSGNFLKAIKELKPEILVSHGAPIKGYRSPDFDQDLAYNRSVENLDEVLSVFKECGGRKLIYSGTVFEPIDGAEALSPYGEMKKRVSDSVESACEQHGIEFSKIYIPNPIGPYENEDRLIPIFSKKWKAKEEPLLTAPRIVWDNIPAPWLAEVYAEECESLEGHVRRPSGYKVELQEFLSLFCDKLQKYAPGAFCAYQVEDKVEPGAKRLNTEELLKKKSSEEQELFWKFWFESLGMIDPGLGG